MEGERRGRRRRRGELDQSARAFFSARPKWRAAQRAMFSHPRSLMRLVMGKGESVCVCMDGGKSFLDPPLFPER